MPYIALQLVGIQVVIKAMGLGGTGILRDLPIVIAFVILAVYTYRGGLRAPALVAIAKDTLIYITVIAAAIIIPAKLGGYGHIFAAAGAAMAARPKPTGLLLPPSEYSAYITLALGSALAIFMYPHNITGVLSASGPRVIRRNMIALPMYSLLLALLATFGYMAIAAGINPETTNEAVPQLFLKMFPPWFAGFGFAAIAIGALVPAAIMSIASANLFTRNIYREYINPTLHRSTGINQCQSCLACDETRRAHLCARSAHRIRNQLSAFCGRLDPADVSHAHLWHVHALVPSPSAASRMGGWHGVATYMPASNGFHSSLPVASRLVWLFRALWRSMALIANLVVDDRADARLRRA